MPLLRWQWLKIWRILAVQKKSRLFLYAARHEQIFYEQPLTCAEIVRWTKKRRKNRIRLLRWINIASISVHDSRAWQAPRLLTITVASIDPIALCSCLLCIFISVTFAAAHWNRRLPVSAKLHYTDTGYGHMLYNTTNGQAHDNSTTCCRPTTNLPHRNARAQHLDMSRCLDVAILCPLEVNLSYNK